MVDENDPKKKGLLAGLLELLGEEEEDTTSQKTPDTAASAESVPDVGEPLPPAPEAEPPSSSADGSAPPTAEAPPEEPRAETPPAAETPREPSPAEPQPGPAPSGPSTDPRLARLTSPAVAERRAALSELVTEGLDEASMGPVLDRLLYDPELDLRLTALEGLRPRRDLIGPETLRPCLQDPADEVRAGVIRLLGELGAGTDDIVRLVGSRRWPDSQAAALETLPNLIDRTGIGDEGVTHLARSVGELDSAPVGRERSGLGGIARTVGHDRLVPLLETEDDAIRLGATRLLLEEGSATSLRAVAGREDDATDEVRVCAALASSILASGPVEETAEPTQEAPAPPPPPVEPPPPPPPTEGRPRRGRVDAAVGAELVAGLARALTDPDEAVRTRARDALAKANQTVVRSWVRGALRAGSEEDARIAAQVAHALDLDEAAVDILERAAGTAAERRNAYLAALERFSVEPATLAGLVRSVEASRRHEAIRLLWQLSGPAVLPHLKPFLDDTAGPIRMAVLEVLGESGDAEAFATAHQVLENDSSPAVRASAVKVLAAAGTDDRLLALSKALGDADPDVRATAVEVLLHGITRHASHHLLKATDDPDERVRGTALRHLASLGAEDFAILWSALRHTTQRQRDELLSILEQQGSERLAAIASIHLDSPSPTDRALAIELAGLAGTPECVRQTIQALRDPDTAVRRKAAEALSDVRSPEAIPALADALKDPSSKVRIEAVRALGVIDDDEIIPVLITALKDPEVRVRDRASEVLTRWSSPGVARRLVEALASADLKRAAGDLLARMGQTAIEPLVEVLLQGAPGIVDVVGDLLSKIAGPDPFLDELASLDPARRLRAVEALGAMGGRRAVDGLIRALTDPDERIRTRSLQHLGRLGDRRAYEEVRRTFASDPVLEVVEAAEEALQRLEPSEDDNTPPE